MSANAPLHALVRFGSFELDLQTGELRKNGIRIRLQQQPLQILVALVTHPGEIVTREELRQQLWANDTFVDFDHGLNAAVKRLRDALGESAEAPVYIETLARRGYRFIAPIASPGATAPGSVGIKGSKKKPLLWVSLVVFVLGIAIAALSIRWPKQPKRNESVPVKLTANSADAPVINAAISPDYTYLAYADKTGLYLKHIRTGEIRPLSLPTGFSAAPLSWFPDGAHLLVSMTEHAGESPGLWMMSTLGGSLRKLMNDVVEASISADGSRIAILRGNTAYEATEIWTMRSDGTDLVKLVPRAADQFVLAVAWSPDSRHLAWVQRDMNPNARPSRVIEVIDTESSKRNVVFSNDQLRCGLMWLADGRLIYTLGEPSGDEDTNAWSVPVTDTGKITGTAVRLTREPGWISKIMATRDGAHLVVLRTELHERAFVARLSPDQNQLLDVRRLNQEETSQSPFAWSPDSTSVIVTSNRNGHMGIYRQAIDQNVLESLIQGQVEAWLPRLSPDGSELLYRIADEARGTVQIFASPISGGPPRLVHSKAGIGNYQCTSSRANFCVFDVKGRNEWVFFRFDPKTGQAQELTRFTHDEIGINWSLSSDGEKLAIVPFSADGNTIYVRSVRTGQTDEIQVKGWSALICVDWASDGNSMFIATLDRGVPTYPTGENALLRVSSDGRARLLLRGNASESWVWAVPSPDGRLLAINGPIRAGNVWAVDTF